MFACVRDRFIYASSSVQRTRSWPPEASSAPFRVQIRGWSPLCAFVRMRAPYQGSSHPSTHRASAMVHESPPECPSAGRMHTLKPDPCPAHLMYSRGRRCDLTAREGALQPVEGHRRQPRRSIIDDKSPVSATARLRARPSPACGPAQRHPRARARRPRPARPSRHHAWRPQPAGSRLRRACHALAFTYAARRDCARTDDCCLCSSQGPWSRSPSSSATLLGSLNAF